MNWITHHELALRLCCFAAILLAMLAWEHRAPKRRTPARTEVWRRRAQHFGITVLNSVALRLLPGIAAVQAAFLAEQHHWGLLHALAWQGWSAALSTLIVLDLCIYFQHRMFHAVPIFWRLHRLHHSDADFDTTTALRFHPIEILLSMLIKFAAVLALGAPAAIVILFEILLNGSALFNHGNVRIPASIDRYLRWFIVTPDMHRVHHSVLPYETNSNYGFSFPWWDRLFGTYRAQPEQGHTGMHIGLKEFPRASTRRFIDLLCQPFIQPQADKPDTPSKMN